MDQGLYLWRTDLPLAHGQGEVSCSRCGTEYNASGQRLRSWWRANPSIREEDISDLEDFELANANDH